MKARLKYQEIKNLIRKNKIEEALEWLIEIGDSLNHVQSGKTLRLLNSNYIRLNEQIRNNIIENQQANINNNKIIIAIQQELDGLEKHENLNLSNKPVKTLNSKPSDELLKTNTQLTEEDVFRVTKTAIITIELEKIKEEFYDAGWEERGEILSKLFKYSDHKTLRLSKEILTFLLDIATVTRSGMTPEIASRIESLVFYYFPYFEKGKEDEEYQNIAFECIHIGYNIFYDGSIHLNNLEVGAQGLQILKWMYLQGKNRGLENVMNEVKETYQKLEATLDRPERNDLENAKKVLQIFKDDLDRPGLQYPIMSSHLSALI